MDSPPNRNHEQETGNGKGRRSSMRRGILAFGLAAFLGITGSDLMQNAGGATMHLYLVRHGEALDEGQDPQRPLSDKGKKEAEKTARHLESFSIKPDRIFHSPKLRAAQTAAILERTLHPVHGAEAAVGLLPNDPPKAWRKRLKEMDGSVFIVGHMPFLARLASLLLSDDAEKIQLGMATGGVICLSRDKKGNWSLQWMIAPGQIK